MVCPFAGLKRKIINKKIRIFNDKLNFINFYKKVIDIKLLNNIQNSFLKFYLCSPKYNSMQDKQIKTALISVYHKDNLDKIALKLKDLGVQILSTGGTQSFLEGIGVDVIPVDSLTEFPAIFGGRVKTLHPQIFGGILMRSENESDRHEAEKHAIKSIDLVIVDLYPFEETVASGGTEAEIIEKIDIGGISLIRAGAKNFNDCLCVASKEKYDDLYILLEENEGITSRSDRKKFAAHAFDISSNYDTAIFNYFNQEDEIDSFKQSIRESKVLRYGENPHQQGRFYGDLDGLFDKLNGKELSYNNLMDVDAAVGLIDEFEDTTFAILKHNNACGLASASTVKEAYLMALAGDPTSAFGGVLITNKEIDLAAAEEIHKLFCEVVIAPAFSDDALTLLKEKKNRVLLKRKNVTLPKNQFKTTLNGVLWMNKDIEEFGKEEYKVVTEKQPSDQEMRALKFANKIVKHTKSNTIVLSNENQLFASGTGQTSRVDALKQAIIKAKSFNFDLSKAVMASDAFFPFPDCVEIASKEGVKAVIQPGGSIKDQESIDFCNANNMSMITTGIRHFKH